MAINPTTSVLLAHYDSVMNSFHLKDFEPVLRGPLPHDHFLDIYYNYEVLGTNSDKSTRIKETVYYEYNSPEITQELIYDAASDAYVWSPAPTINRYWYRHYWPLIDINTSSGEEHLEFGSYRLGQFDVYKDKTLKSIEITKEPWSEVSETSGNTYQYRKVKGIFQEVIREQYSNIPGSITLNCSLKMYVSTVIEDHKLQDELYIPEMVKMYFSEYINIEPSRILYDDSSDIDFTLTNTNKTFYDAYVELVPVDDRDNPIISAQRITSKFSTLTTSLSWTNGYTEADSPYLQRLYECLGDKKEIECYIQVGYCPAAGKPYTISTAQVTVTLAEYTYNGTEAQLYPEIQCQIEDTNQLTYSLTGNPHRIVRYVSNAKATMSATGKKGAQIVIQKILTSNAQINNTSYTFEGISDGNIHFYARDSRGYASTVAFNDMVFLEYVKPTCNITDIGLPAVDDTCRVVVSGMYWNDNFGAVNNKLTLKYRYKSTSIPEYVSWKTISEPQIEYLWSEHGYNAVFDVDLPNHIDAFTIQIMAQDKLASGESGTRTVRSFPIFDWGEHDFHFNIPVNIDGDLHVNGVITSNTPEAQQIEPADYIIEQGTRQTGSGNSLANWTFRKWNSGMYECWCRKHIQTGVSTAWGNMYVSGALPHTNLIWPGAFIDIPVANITIAPNASGAFLIAGGSTNLTATNTGGYEIARGTSLSSGNFYINYYGMGRWK